MSNAVAPRYALARMLTSAVTSQAWLSAISFAIGLVLIRLTSDTEYGAYVLAVGAIALLVSLQNAYIGPTMAVRLNQLDLAGRDEFIGNLNRERRTATISICGLAGVVFLGCWSAGLASSQFALFLLATTGAAFAVLFREYLRLALYSRQRPQDVLLIDILYGLILLGAVYLATRTGAPATTAVMGLGLASALSAWQLSRIWRRSESSRTTPASRLLGTMAPLAAWSTLGAAVHWTFSQGYVYLVAATLDVSSVAAIAATRQLLMPVNLLCSGIGSIMLPLAFSWLSRHGVEQLFRRLALIALVLSAVTLCYFGVLWEAREWLFSVVLKKQFAQSDELLLLWGLTFLVIAVRDQIAFLQAAQGRFRALTLLTVVSATVSLLASYLCMLRWGVPGALFGILLGELISLSGVVCLSLQQAMPQRRMLPFTRLG